VQVLAGTVLGHVGPGTSGTGAVTAESAAPHMLSRSARPAPARR